MSGQRLADFLGYWQSEGEAYARHGDYDWMAAQLPGRRVLEIGCGPGFGTAALAAGGRAVFSVDSQPDCIAAASARTGGGEVRFAGFDLAAPDPAVEADILAFAPDSVVCWLMGAPAEVTGAKPGDGGKAVIAYRERMHRLVAELASRLPEVRHLHLVDRTALAWAAKDVGRDVLVRYHGASTVAGLPWRGERRHALYRKLDEAPARSAAPTAPALRGMVPVLASLLFERIS